MSDGSPSRQLLTRCRHEEMDVRIRVVPFAQVPLFQRLFVLPASGTVQQIFDMRRTDTHLFVSEAAGHMNEAQIFKYS